MLRRLYEFLVLCPLSICLAEPVRINEFLADNTATSLQDEDLDTPDWIEFYNPAGAPVNLAGWYLTDDAGDLTKWQFPAVSIPAHGYLLVFASGKNRAPTNGDPLHASFVLAQAGEYVALVGPDGTSVISEFGPGGSNYPEQRPGVSYGFFESPGQVGFLFNPTPNAANDDSSAVLGFVDDTEFDIDRGFFTDPFYVTIATSTPGATIRYTTDGSWPSESVGTIYTEPVLVRRTLPLKAIAYKPGSVSSNVDTQTYIFVDDVVGQTSSNTQSLWGFPSSWNGQAPYYGMNGNPKVDPLTNGRMKNALQRVPTLSISMETDDLFGSSGIYSNPQNSGQSWERLTSLEFIDPDHPDGSNNFQQNCAIRIQGGAFRSFGLTRKKSLRVLFKSDYGPANLPTGGPGKLDFPLFGPDAATDFQTLTFRMEANDGWQWSGAGNQPQYARDEFGRRAQLALGQPASHGRYCHIYLNGVYWGVYNVVERPDSGFAESYFGATRELWQGQNSGTPINDATSTGDWGSMLGEVAGISSATSDFARDRKYLQVCGFTSSGARRPSATVWIDPDNFADYLLVNWYGGNSDWPHKNYYCGRAAESTSTGYKFFMWDAEWSLLLRSDLGTNQTGNFAGVAAPQQHLVRSPEYRVRFGDHAHAALFNDGVFVPENATALFREITEDHLNILIPEAARWGNQHGGQHDTNHWRGENRRLVHPDSGWFALRPSNLLAQLRVRGLYPDLDAPTYSQHGGSISSGGGPTLSVPDHITKVYYLYGPGDADPTDYGHSLDPRLILGAIDPAATLIDFGSAGDGNGTHTSAALALTEPGFLFSRSYDSGTGEWSALNTALFTLDTVPANASRIVVSEIHYHPEAPSAAEIAAGFADQDLFEFLEVQNIGSASADMTGVDFIAGLEFEFPPGFTLAPGARAVIVKDLGAFNYRYQGFPASQIAGAFLNDSGLRNSGETLTMRAADGSLIKDFAYDDEEPWATAPDGLTGVSLVLMFGDTNPDHGVAGNWRASATAGGNPGETDLLVFAGDPNADQDGDGVLAYVEHALGTSDHDLAERETMKFGVQTIEISGNLDDYFTITFSRDLRAEDVEIVPQVSADMIDWNAGPVTPVTVSEVTSSGTRVEVTYRLSAPLGSHESLFVRLLSRAR